jgi:GT2 family glycosyltransferase
MKYSIIIPVFNNLFDTISCLHSIQRNTKNYEVFVVDNGSTDETPAYLKSQAEKNPSFHVITFPENRGFAPACNAPLVSAQGEYVVFLNNDTLVTPDWTEHLAEAMPLAEKTLGVSNVALSGPVTGNAAGPQCIQTDQYNMENLDDAAKAHYEKNQGNVHLAGFLSGFCLMVKRECLDDIGGFDENFQTGGWEDNDLCLRAWKAGWKSCIDPSTYIHHYGQRTLKTLAAPYAPQYRVNQLYFMDKHHNDTPKCLAVVIRVKNNPAGLYKALTSASTFADKIFVLCDRCTDTSYDVAISFPKVEKALRIDEDFNEFRDRKILLQEAQASGADWTFSLDADEVMEDSFDYRTAHLLMNPLDPQTLAYGFNVMSFFLGNTHYRTDGTFGQLWGVRMWRNLEGQEIRSVGHEGLHCTHGPMMPAAYTKQIRHRILHYGYDTPKKCQEKYAFYSLLDPHPDPVAAGPQGYKHLVSPALTLQEFRKKNDLALAMVVKDEEINLFAMLSRYSHLFDQIVIVDTGSRDRTKNVALMFGAEVYDFRWRDNFAAARNFAKSKCKTAWIMTLDPDEEVRDTDTPTLFKLIEQPVDAFLFRFLNYQQDNTIIYSDNVRLMRNIPEITWGNRCHENITAAAAKNKLTIVPAPFDIRHFGFLKDDATRKRKLRDYGHMLQRQINENPKQAIGYFHQAFHFFEIGKERQGMENLKRTLAIEPKFFLSAKELGLRHLIEAQKYLSLCAEVMPENHYFHKWIAQTAKRVTETLDTPIEVIHET